MRKLEKFLKRSADGDEKISWELQMDNYLVQPIYGSPCGFQRKPTLKDIAEIVFPERKRGTVNFSLWKKVPNQGRWFFEGWLGRNRYREGYKFVSSYEVPVHALRGA